MNKEKNKNQKQQRRRARVRAKIFGTAEIPRLNVFRSLKHVSVQLIDDENGKTIASVNYKEIDKKVKNDKMTTKVNQAFEVGKIIAKKALDPTKNKTGKKIKKCVFDKSRYKYHGRIKAVADGAREGGLNF